MTIRTYALAATVALGSTALAAPMHNEQMIPMRGYHGLKNGDCWAACCWMVINYYKPTDFQLQLYNSIWTYGAGGQDIGNELCTSDPGKNCMSAILNHFGLTYHWCQEGETLSLLRLYVDMCAYKPIIAAWEGTKGGQREGQSHAVVIYSLDYVEGRVIYYDPGYSYLTACAPYEVFVKNAEWTWYGFIEMTRGGPTEWYTGPGEPTTLEARDVVTRMRF